MKKAELIKLKPQYATPHMMMLAAEDVPTRIKHEWSRSWSDHYKRPFYMRGKVDNGIVRIAIFLTEKMRHGNNKASFEIFIDTNKRDFVTYDYDHEKWSNAKIDLLPWPAYKFYGAGYSNRAFNKFIRKQLGVEKGGYYGVLAWQQSVRIDQLNARHKKETDPWDEVMNRIPELPADWDRWVDKCGITQNFIFYKYVRNGAKTGYCTWCEDYVSIKNPRHNAAGRCMKCKHDIVYKSVGKAGTVVTERERVYLLQKFGKGLVARQFGCYKRYPRVDYFDDLSTLNTQPPQIACYEERRVIFDESFVPTAYYYGVYKQQNTRWIYNGSPAYSGGWWNSRDLIGTVYKRTIPSLKSTLARTGLTEMIYSLKKTDPETYLLALKKKPYIEQLSKAGLTQLVSDAVFNFSYHDELELLENARDLGKALQIDRARMKRLRNYNGSFLFLSWLRFEKYNNKSIGDDIIQWFVSEGVKPDDIRFILNRMSERQVKNYLIRQKKDMRCSAKEIISTWDDYLKMASRAKMNVNDEIVYRVKMLKKRHDELIKNLGSKNLAIRAGEIALKFPNVDKVCEEIKTKYSYEKGDYAIIVPERIEDILNEGQALHHCIDRTDRYFERIHTRESFLVFLRKSDDKLKPWYTLEVEPDGTIRQKRTEYDRQNKDLQDAESFLRDWQKHIRKSITQEDMELAAKSRELRIKEFEDMRENNVRIPHGHLAGHLLVEVLEADLVENSDNAERRSA